MMSIEEKLKKLDGLYEITKEDWYLSISHSLTEPYAPVVTIRPEGSNSTRYTVWGDSIEEGIDKAINLVYREVILGEKITPEAPFTNSDDRKEPKPWQPE